MLTALTPLGLGTPRRRRWVFAVTTFTLAGLIASAMVGGALAGAGALLELRLDRGGVVLLSTVGAVAVAVRELNIVQFGWPQPHRASNGGWGRRFGQVPASFLWGIDIGAYFSTWMTYVGAWWLAAIAAMSGQIAFGALLFMVYWAGRALSVWLGPWIVRSSTLTPWVAAVWMDMHSGFRIIHTASVVMGAAAVIWAGAG